MKQVFMFLPEIPESLQYSIHLDSEGKSKYKIIKAITNLKKDLNCKLVLDYPLSLHSLKNL